MDKGSNALLRAWSRREDLGGELWQAHKVTSAPEVSAGTLRRVADARGRAAWHIPGLDTPIATTAVDAFAIEERVAMLATRSIKTSSKLALLDLAIRCMDLTTLEGVDTRGRVEALCSRAIRPLPGDASVPSVAAVCVYPEMVSVAVHKCRGTGVKVASVAGAFPSGLSSIEVRLADIRAAVADGADEIDIVLNRSAFLSGDYARAFDDIASSVEAAGHAHVKTILETGELGSLQAVREASMLAMAAGSHVIKTSTGKIGTSATPPVALCMAESIRDFHDATGTMVGLKLAGGIRTAKQAWQYLVLINETLGADWMHPDYFRFGASSLLNDVLLQLGKERTGRYQRLDYLPVD